MTAAEYAAFRHAALHELIDKNEGLNTEFRIGDWEHWDYDLDEAKLVFSGPGKERVAARIQVVGSTSGESDTWMWAWANGSLPSCVTRFARQVREFGGREQLAELTTAVLPDSEELGWALTAAAAKIAGAKGGYRCPTGDGYLYLVYEGLDFSDRPPDVRRDYVECADHGQSLPAYVCVHLAANPTQAWYSAPPTPDDPFPDAWCSVCDLYFQQEGEWNEANEDKITASLLCRECYQSARRRAGSGSDFTR